MASSDEMLYDHFNQFFVTFLPQFSSQSNILQNWQQFLQLLKSKPLDYTKIYTLINRMNLTEERINHHSNNHQIEERSNSTSKNNTTINQLASRNNNITTASSPRPISTVQKQKESKSFFLQKKKIRWEFKHQWSQQSNQQIFSIRQRVEPKNKFIEFIKLIANNPQKLNSISFSIEQLSPSNFNVNVKKQTEDFNRHLLLSKTKELLFTLSVSSDKLNAIARFPMINYYKENSNNNSHQKSPIKQPPVTIQQYQAINQHGYNHQQVVKSRGNNHSAEHYTLASQKVII